MHKVKQFLTKNADSTVTLSYPVSNTTLLYMAGERAVAVSVTAIEQTVGDDLVGDLAVTWETEVALTEEQEQEVCDMFYSAEVFTDDLREHLLEAGFSADAVEDIYTSEEGMQQAGRASYDAHGIAAEILAIMNS